MSKKSNDHAKNYRSHIVSARGWDGVWLSVWWAMFHQDEWNRAPCRECNLSWALNIEKIFKILSCQVILRSSQGATHGLVQGHACVQPSMAYVADRRKLSVKVSGKRGTKWCVRGGRSQVQEGLVAKTPGLLKTSTRGDPGCPAVGSMSC